MGEVGAECRYKSSTVAQVFYLLYVFVVIIILSNVLIAIITDSYGVIKNERAAMVFWSNRLIFVAEADAIQSGLGKVWSLCRRGGGRSRDGRITALPEVDRLIAEGCPSGGGTKVTARLSGGDDDLGIGFDSDDVDAGVDVDIDVDVTVDVDVDVDVVTAADPADASLSASDSLAHSMWSSLLSVFDSTFLHDVSTASVEYLFLATVRLIVIVVLIPLWLLAGAATFGVLWPPQVREGLLVQTEMAASRADIVERARREVAKLRQNFRSLRHAIREEIRSDQIEVTKLKEEVDSVTADITYDIHRMGALMKTLLELSTEQAKNFEEGRNW